MIKEYRKLLNELGLQPCECVLSGSGGLAMYGLRDQVGDLDIDVSKEVFNRLIKTGCKVKIVSNPSSELIEYNGLVDIHCLEDSQRRLGHPIHVRVTDGVGHYCAKTLLRQKEWLNREKDQRDIDRLKVLLNPINSILR